MQALFLFALLIFRAKNCTIIGKKYHPPPSRRKEKNMKVGDIPYRRYTIEEGRAAYAEIAFGK